MSEKNNKIIRFAGISSFALHILAMVFMLMDHLWAKVLPNQLWLTFVGRLAFPIFAFMIVEGYFHTRNLKKYLLKLVIVAVISEVPFDLMYSNIWFYPFHQNVLWTYLLGLGVIILVEFSTRWKRRHLWLTLLIAFFSSVIAAVLGRIIGVDFFSGGVLTVLIFYFFSPRRDWGYLKKERFPKWIQVVFFDFKIVWCYALQLLCMYYVHYDMIGGRCYIVNLFGHEVELVWQAFAIFALIPIWLYTGRQGYHKKWFSIFCYAFYPAHCLILGLIGKFFY